MRYFIFVIALTNLAFGYCYYVPCNANINLAAQQTKTALLSEFQNVMNELRELKQKYELNLKSYKKSNEFLEKQIALAKQKALNNKELVFLLTQFNQSLSTTIDTDSIVDTQNAD